MKSYITRYIDNEQYDVGLSKMDEHRASPDFFGLGSMINQRTFLYT
jgi:hypothetical protein